MSLAVSVVAPTFRRPDLLARCLQALLAQDLAPTAYEIIIVDDAASKETRLQVESCARRAASRGLQVSYLATAGACGPAVARNLGWQAAQGAIIAFTDDDCLPVTSALIPPLAIFWRLRGMVAFQVFFL